MASKLDYICRSLSKGTSKVYETYVVNAIWQRLNNDNIEFITQQYVFKDGIRSYIDMYFPQIRLAVEVDEMYHNTACQINSDNKRMERIQLASLDSLISEPEIKFERIHIGDENGQFPLEKIENRINEVVEAIKKRYKEAGSPKWVYGSAEKLKAIKKTGKLKRGISLLFMTEIMELFGRHYKAAMQCYYKIQDNLYVWSPWLSSSSLEDCQWNNTISNDLNVIVERDRDGKKKTIESCKWDRENHVKRLVFLHYKDPVGSSARKFLGVYVAGEYNDKTHEQTWNFVSDEFDLKDFLNEQR